MTEIYLHFMCAHYGLYGNAPVVVLRGRDDSAASASVPLLGRVFASPPRRWQLYVGSCTVGSCMLAVRVRVQLIGHARNNVYVNLSHAWL